MSTQNLSFRRWKKIFFIIFDDFLNWNKPNVLLNFEKSWINLEHRNFLSKSHSWYWCLSVSVSDRYRPIWKKSYRQFIGSADLKNGIYRCLSVSADMKKSLSVVPCFSEGKSLSNEVLYLRGCLNGTFTFRKFFITSHLY